jgi:hypothetical protein
MPQAVLIMRDLVNKSRGADYTLDFNTRKDMARKVPSSGQAEIVYANGISRHLSVGDSNLDLV